MKGVPRQHEPADFSAFPELDAGPLTISGRFEQICRLHPQRPAVIDASRQTTYAELWRMTTAFCSRLEAMVPDKPARAGLVADVGLETAVASMALIRAGIPFVPVDPALTDERKIRIAESCRFDAIVAGSAHAGLFSRPAADDRLIVVEPEPSAHPVSSVPGAAADNEIVCWIMTSGSTGEPKLVLYNAAMILHDVSVRTNLLKFSPSDRFAQWMGGTSLPLMTQFLALLNGASLCVRDARVPDTASWVDWLEQQGISVLRLTPTLLRILASRLSSPLTLDNLRLVSTGGESLGKRDARLFFERFPPHTMLVNHLSATEYRVACQYVVPRDLATAPEIVPVGYPLDGFEIDVVDENDVALADGQTGEMVIRGKYLSPGYFDTATGETTWFPRAPGSGEIVFHSRDLGLRRADGCFEFRGRADRTAKIRGQRVELDAMEALLRSLPGVQQAAVVVHDRPGGAELVAFVEPATAEGVELGLVRRAVYARLGLYGMPHRLLQRSRLPLTTNGKIDRGLLAGEARTALAS